MKIKRVAYFLAAAAICLSLSACAMPTLGPPGAKGAQAVICQPVQSTDGSVRVDNPAGDSFFIKFKDTTGKGIDLQQRVAKSLAESGKYEARSVKDAYYVIDIVVQNFTTGKVGTTLGTDEGRQQIIDQGGDSGDLLLGEILAASHPSTCAFEADLLIDEIKPPSKANKPVDQKVGKKGASTPRNRVVTEQPKAEPESVQTKTVLSIRSKYMAHQANEDDAIAIMSDNMAKYIADMFK